MRISASLPRATVMAIAGLTCSPEPEDPPAKKRRLSLSLKDRKTKQERFTSDSPKVDKLKRKVVPHNTEKNMEWALKVFRDWMDWRKGEDKEASPQDILVSEDGVAICRWLCKFFTEVRKDDGLEYCPRNLSCILGGLHRYIESHSPHGLKLNTGDEFKPLHTLLDNLFRELHAKGIGASKCQAAPITDEEESKLRESGVLGSSNPDALSNSVFFL